MKISRLVNAASVGVLSFGLATIPFSISASAQDATNPVEDTVESAETAVEDAEFDWGLLGLLGLLGLAGLAGKKRDDVEVHHRTDVTRTDATPGYSNIPPTSQGTDVPRYRDPNAINRPEYRE
jgi:hypothetical protein